MQVIESTPSRAVVTSDHGSFSDKNCTFAGCDCSKAVITEYHIEDWNNVDIILTNSDMDNQQFHSMKKNDSAMKKKMTQRVL